ncbi:MAG: hypothetical protein ACYS8Z_13070 [Planctomycetota bacterium]|jgi:hypothetical protein
MLTLKLDSFKGRDRYFPIPIDGKVSIGVESVEQYLFLGYIRDSGKHVDKKITLTYADSRTVEVDSVKLPDWLKAEYDVDSSEQGRLQLRLRIEVVHAKRVRDGEDNLEIVGSVERQPFAIRLPIIYVFKQ